MGKQGFLCQVSPSGEYSEGGDYSCFSQAEFSILKATLNRQIRLNQGFTLAG